jgi:hypothetical protein
MALWSCGQKLPAAGPGSKLTIKIAGIVCLQTRQKTAHQAQLHNKTENTANTAAY